MDRRGFLVNASAAAAALAAGLAPRAGAQEGESPKAGAAKAPRSFRLRYAPHFGMFGAHAKSDLDQIAFLADEGFTALEDNGMRGRSKEDQQKIGEALARRAISMGVFVANDIDWTKPTLTTGKKEHLDRFVANLRESVEVARRVNAKWMTVVPGVVEPRLPGGVQTAHVVEALRRGAEIFEKAGLVMVCEPLNWRDHPGQFLRRSDEAYAVMKAVGSPACKILFDLYHQQVTEGDLLHRIDECWDEIAYFQIGDNPGRCEPGTGEVNYRNVFRHIHGRGFAGILGMEHGSSRGGREGERAVIEAYRQADAF